jgi:hypothetical protein
MFSIRNLGGVALFLFGTTYMWLTPLFAKSAGTAATRTALWSITMVLCVIIMLGFTVATWGLFIKASWWKGVAIASALAGLLVLIPYWIAAHLIHEPAPWYNVLIHALGAAAVLVLLRVPVFSSWVGGHVMAGR